MIYSFKGFIPVIRPTAYVHPQATVTGNVIIGENVYIGPGCALRGDWGAIIIGNGCNVQENCTIHMFPGAKAVLEDNAHIGHGAIIHGATVGKNCLVGMNAVLMDDVVLGDECIVGALTFIAASTIVPARSLIVGNPGKIIKQVSDEMIDWKSKGTALYQTLPEDMRNYAQLCEPLREMPTNRPDQSVLYTTWDSIKNNK